ncbi:MAG: 5-(carboxyamino)imidazole ribonucleotide synthase [Actinobacteria bacterium]|nr:5-(carboxyamino)imidazole ribonucleotide synthase [Actinomycetota bacterium]
MSVGIVGGGQLGRMLALAAAPLGIECTVLDPADDACASVAANHLRAEFDDTAALARLSTECDAVTFEFENVPAEGLAAVNLPRPPASALAASQDRLTEKQLFERIGIATAPYRAVETLDELRDAVAEIGTPAVLKTRRLGYDGKGQARLADPSDTEDAWSTIGAAPAIIEGLVEFERELSIVAVRGAGGEMAFYPLTENVHRHGILRESRAPAAVDAAGAASLAQTARRYAQSLLDELDYVGVLALELFQHGPRLLANEFAPRVHNSGHWTIDAAPTSQFENHIRAVAGLPLGATEPAGECVMLNLIGGAPSTEQILAVPGAHLHLYGKQPRPGRKIGHVTLTATPGLTAEEAAERLRAAVETAAR